MTDEEIIEVVSALKANDKTMKDNGISDNLWGKAVECITFLQFENAKLKSSLTHANEECLKWHERTQNLLKDSSGSISGYEKKISDLQSENDAMRERLENAIEVPFVFNKKVFVIVHGKKGNPYLFEGIVTGIGTDTNKLHEGEIDLLMSVVNKVGEAHFINGKQYRKQWFCEDEIEYAKARITELNGENNNG